MDTTTRDSWPQHRLALRGHSAAMEALQGRSSGSPWQSAVRPKSATWRHLAVVLGLASVCALPALAQEAAYPRKPITLVVPFAAGGGTDTVARLLGQKLQLELGQPVVIDNRPGANGIVASRSVLQQPADGYTLLLGSNSTHVIAPLAAKLPADGIKAAQTGFTVVSVIANAPLVLAVRSNAAERDLAAFIKRAKTAELSYGTFGAGSSAHVMGEVLAEDAKIKLLHVPYKGSAPALTDLLGSQVDAIFLTVAAIEGSVAGGSVRPLAVTGRSRLQTLPDVPTFDELGVHDMGNSGWFAVFAGTQTPPAIIDKVSAALRKAVALPDVRTKLIESGLEPVGSTPHEGREIWNRSVTVAEPVVKRAHIEF
ncbi:MAG: tripartite tricarboxylate transporter substrate binding protein [Burkholderiales bacterium]